MIWGAVYLCIGLALSVMLLKHKPPRRTDGSYEGLVCVTCLFWPLVLFIMIPFLIANGFGWWEIPDE